ncbi:hypothetical protein COEREDRAFT_12657 [Coemansia reversa NRRL 1564]|uniref:Uncharacterized protein n=1 Tax=Coemansia reversa (strain ATCC 12441 / NRRL 1564) TaxID=763665 RepID=A0A2G5B0H1_COERN|nr:hypothetical protein COEREDRAFT_12657 [Coemansia reversa NRRL 1564]|eukprot:PIA12526.1 hypothetical protein COEREDRAFT_12657 [Coemansia reversa NRRL 1564]
MNADQFSQFMASATVLPGQTQVLKFSDFKGIVAPLIPQEQKANAKFAPDAETLRYCASTVVRFPTPTMTS